MEMLSKWWPFWASLQSISQLCALTKWKLCYANVVISSAFCSMWMFMTHGIVRLNTPDPATNYIYADAIDTYNVSVFSHYVEQHIINKLAWCLWEFFAKNNNFPVLRHWEMTIPECNLYCDIFLWHVHSGTTLPMGTQRNKQKKIWHFMRKLYHKGLCKVFCNHSFECKQSQKLTRIATCQTLLTASITALSQIKLSVWCYVHAIPGDDGMWDARQVPTRIWCLTNLLWTIWLILHWKRKTNLFIILTNLHSQTNLKNLTKLVMQVFKLLPPTITVE